MVKEILLLCLSLVRFLWTIKGYRCGIKWRPEIERFICSHRLHIWYKAGINVLWSWQGSWLGIEGMLECQMACVLIGPCSNWKSLAVRFLSVLVATLNSTPVPRKMFIFFQTSLGCFFNWDWHYCIHQQTKWHSRGWTVKCKCLHVVDQILFISKHGHHALLVAAQWLRFTVETKLVCFFFCAQQECFFFSL